MKPLFLSLISVVFFVTCDVVEKKTTIQTKVDVIEREDSLGSYNERFSIIGDFNGDENIDTLYESYISSTTKLEIEKVPDYNDFERNIELIIQNKPLTRIYSSIVGIDTLIVTDDFQQSGLRNFLSLGDINSDGCDEFGFMINWADYSNLNTFYIYSIKGNNFKKIFSFQINESVNFDNDNLFDNGFLIRSITNKTIEYKFYSDSATVEMGRHTFD
jgi:hypothetical protein